MSIKKCMLLTLGETVIKKEFDESPDTSWMGEYTDSAKVRKYHSPVWRIYRGSPGRRATSAEAEGSIDFFHPPDGGEKIRV